MTQADDSFPTWKCFTKNGGCSGRTRVEKGLLFLAGLLALAVIGLTIALVLEVGEKDESREEICETPDCAMATARVLDSVDLTVNPCDDFYEFACGGWRRKNVIPDDEPVQTVFNLVREDVKVVLKYLLEDPNKYSEIESVQKAKDLYQSCIDLDTIENKNQTVAIPFLESMGGWPMLGSNPGGRWNESEFDLATLLTKLRLYNNRAVVDMYVSSDVKDSMKHIIYFDRPSFGLPGRLYYLNNDKKNEGMREAYVQFGKAVAELFGADPNTAEASMREVLALEIDLAYITITNEERRDIKGLYNKMNISMADANFTSSTDTIPFSYTGYAQLVMGTTGVDIPVNDSEQVVVKDLRYYQRLASVLDRYDKRVVSDYLVWYIMKRVVRMLPARFTDLYTKYKKVVFGIETASTRWRDCVGYATSIYGMSVGHMFVKETFDQSAKDAALDMINNIRKAFNELLEELDWMDEQTKALAREKDINNESLNNRVPKPRDYFGAVGERKLSLRAGAMRERIGFTNDILDIDALNKRYENSTADATDYFHNVLNNLKRKTLDGLKDLRKKVDINDWTLTPSTVNAYYTATMNVITFPAGILQPPFYSKGQPRSMNFGGIGTVIGHEITHGFDDKGRQFDKDGNLQDWWEKAVVTQFKQKAQCIIDQYSAFEVPGTGLNVNGINTQGENIADNGGLKQSFRAYINWVKTQGREEPRLAGLNYTHHQLFFINFAQLWCQNLRKEAVIGAINIYGHSPGRFRVTGSLQNSYEFAKAFGCAKGSNMNPSRKCYVW